MGIRMKAGRLRAVIAVAAGALLTGGILAALPASSEPAAVQDDCTPFVSNDIENWSTIYSGRGVTACLGTGIIGEPRAYIQIVDLEAGAKLRLISEETTSPWFPQNPDLFAKRRVVEWHDWIKDNVSFPDSSRLFSTSNASFFVDDSGDETRISLPHMVHDQRVWGTSHSYGHAFYDNGDPAWGALKRALVIGDPLTAAAQHVEISEFPTHYTQSDVLTAFDCLPVCGFGPRKIWDGTVGFQPLYGVVDPERQRTFVGVVGSKVIILNAEDFLTLGQAQNIVQSFGSQMSIQLDGGRSSQVHIDTPDGVRAGFGFRDVPDVLAVYLAPN